MESSHKDTKESTSDFNEAFGEWLEFINKKCISQGISIHERPWIATMELLNNVVTGTRNIEKERLKEPPYLGHFYNNVRDWFKEKYGDALKSNSDKTDLYSFTIIENIPFKLRIPKLLDKKGDKKFHRTLIFAEEVFDDEDPFEWIVNKPNMEKINDNDRIKDDIKKRATFLRKSYMKKMLLLKATDQMKLLSEDILPHLENYAESVIKQYKTGVSNGLWELHLAIEKSIKLALLHDGIQYPPKHDLSFLYGLLKQNFKTDLFKTFPDFKTVAKCRYGELKITGLTNLNNYYLKAISFIHKLFESAKTKAFTTGSIKVEIEDVLHKDYKKEELGK